MKLKDKAKKLISDIPTVFFAIKYKKTPLVAKIFGGIIIIYALSPIDLMPDFIPILGYIDDLIILPLLIAFTVKFIPKHILDECRTKSIFLWIDGKSKKWYYAIPILFIWSLIFFFIIKVIFL